MVKKKRRFSIEFKQEAVRMVRDSGRPTSQVADELGIAQATLYEWVKTSGGSTEKVTFAERDELQRLRKENANLKMERDFLKKVSAFFAKDSK